MAKPKEKLVLRAMVYPGDLLMLTSAIRDLHIAYPNRFLTDVDTTSQQIWDNNPYITPVDRIETHRYLNVGYPAYSHGESCPEHLATRYHRKIGALLGLSVPVTKAWPEVYLSEEEKDPEFPRSLGLRKPYWILVAGGKYDTTTKWWNPSHYQDVVDRLDGRIDFVQCGSSEDWHLPLRGAVNMVGKTDIREFVRLVYHADGVLCPVTFAMHLAAAVPTVDGRSRSCVVIVGGRETPSLIQYPNHTLMQVIGQLDCCREKGCWRYVCQETHVHQVLNSRCEKPIQVTSSLKLPLCMEMIQPQTVVHAILRYYHGRPHATVKEWNGNGATHARNLPPRRFAYTHPRHLQEHYEKAGGENVYKRAIRNHNDFAGLIERTAPVDLLLVGNLLEAPEELACFCDQHSIDRVYGEYGWFPHYATEHADPLGYAWNSSLCQMTFSRLTRRQRVRVSHFRKQFLSQKAGPLPQTVQIPFVLWPMQLIADRVNRYDLNLSDWYDLILWTRQILPVGYQLVIKHHPVTSAQPRLDFVRCLPNTIILDKSAPLRSLIEQSAGVIGCNSTVLLESRFLFNKPTWAYGRSWYTGHPELVFPIRVSERLPNREMLGKPLDDPWLEDYATWFLWHLLARQYSTSEARKDPKGFVQWIHRRTAQSYAALGEDAFN
ncbi:MAG: glycosyltransferase family 9 protein [Candidatus Acidiferrum sp.]|jgi:ADP-heptose:LPS heptosyltransferase